LLRTEQNHHGVRVVQHQVQSTDERALLVCDDKITPTMKHYSLLDLSPIIEGGDAALAFRNTLDLAQHAEEWGYYRYWLAEHHNLPGIASAATALVIGHVAGGTKRIRVGAGGIMLPNHAPLVIAEQFGTLDALYPGRIDLGLGRAPGSDQLTARALRRNLGSSGDTFPQDVLELQSYLAPAEPEQALQAVPGAGANVPLYLLGSSDFSARLAAELGLPFAFASHFAPEYLDVALELYRRHFQPSAALARPHAMVGVAICAAETDREAERLFTSGQLQFLEMVRGRAGKLPAPVESMEGRWNAGERAAVMERTRVAAVGAPATVRARLEMLLERTAADEIIATAQIYDHKARLRSFEIAAEVLKTFVRRENVMARSPAAVER
jgi:luciferase family oxidoreductase group 1